MNYTCKKCHVRQSVKEDVSAIPKCDCGQEMVPDALGHDDNARKIEGMLILSMVHK